MPVMSTLVPDLPVSHRAPRAPRKRRVFLWVFLGIQLVFLILAVIAMTSGSGDAAAQAAAHCKGQGSQFYTYAQCVRDYRNGYQVGTALGTGFLVFIWAAVDIILGIGYLIVRLARR